MAMGSHCARPVSRPRRTPGRTPRQRTVLSEQVRSGGASGTAGARPDRSSASNARPASSEAGTPSTETAARGRKRIATTLLPGGEHLDPRAGPRPHDPRDRAHLAQEFHASVREVSVCERRWAKEEPAEATPTEPAPQTPETAPLLGSFSAEQPRRV